MPHGEVGLQVRIRTSADASGVEQTTRTLGEMDRGVTSATGSIREMGRAGHEVTMVLHGLAEGGVRGTFQAVRGLSMMARTLGPAFVEVASVAGPAIVGVSLIMSEFNRRVAENERAIKSDSDAISAAGATFKTIMEADEKALEKFTKGGEAQLADLTNQIKLMNEQLAQADARITKLAQDRAAERGAASELAEQQALRGVTDPNQRTVIQQGFAARRQADQFTGEANQLTLDRLNAPLDIQRQNDVIVQADQQRRAIQLERTRRDEDAAELLRQAGASLQRWGATAGTLELQAQAKAAKAAADKFRESAEKLDDQLAEVIRNAEAKIQEAETVLESLDVRSKALREKVAAFQLKRAAEEKETAGQIGARGASDADLAALNAELARVGEENLRNPTLGAGADKEAALRAQIAAALASRQASTDAMSSYLQESGKQDRAMKRDLDGAIQDVRDLGPGG